MTFQSAKSNIQINEEPVYRKGAIPSGEIPVLDIDGKMKSSGVPVSNVSTQNIKAIAKKMALIYG